MNEKQKNKIIGLGEHSFRKSYYPQLQHKISELNIFKTIFENSIDGIILFDLSNGVIQFVNKTVRELFKGHSFVDHSSIRDLFGKKYWNIVNDVLKTISKNNNGDNFQFKIKNNYASIYLLNTVTIIKEKNNEFGLLNIKDYTATIRMQQQLETASEQAKINAQKKQSLLNAIPDMMFTFDKDGVIVDYSAPNESDLFLKPSFFLFKNIKEVLPPNIAKLTTRKIKEVLSTQKTAAYTYEVNFKDNIETYDARLAPIDKEYTLAIVRNITERVQMINDLRKAKEKAEESDKLKSTFLANMSHEIRTPLNGIVGFSNMLTEKQLDEATKQQFTKIINKSSEDLLRIINDILDISKIEAGQMNIKYETFNIHIVLDELYRIFTERLQDLKSPVALVKDYEENSKGIIITSDDTRIKQVFINLLDNAIKFTEKGEIKFGYKIYDQEIAFHVIDTGIGIPEAEIDFIFDRFRQSGRPLFETSSGTGLGLSICKGIVEMLGGEIWVLSEPNTGSSFFFTISLKN